MNNHRVITSSEIETQKLGEQFAAQLKPGNIVYLIGQLGSGKTTFAKGVAKGLGVTTRIISPTYVVVRQHHVTRNQKSKLKGIKRLYHLDLYRLNSEQDVLGIDIHDLIKDKNAVTIIEWPEIASSILPHYAWKITFDIEAENTRNIMLQKNTS